MFELSVCAIYILIGILIVTNDWMDIELYDIPENIRMLLIVFTWLPLFVVVTVINTVMVLLEKLGLIELEDEE